MSPLLRQPFGSRFSTLADGVARALAVLAGAALFWYGLMAVMLAAKVDPDTVNALSGYRWVYEELAALTAQDVDGAVRAIAAGAGLVAFLLFGWLALRMLPRPYVARREVVLETGPRGGTDVAPRALERLAEGAALQRSGVSDAAARWRDDGIELTVSLRTARDLPEALREVRTRVRDALDDHGVPVVPVDVTLGGLEPRSRRREVS